MRGTIWRINQFKAFTLVELMIVLAILSIIAAIALPTYDAVVRKTQRVEGQTLLLEVQSQMERYYFNYQTYPDRLSQLRHYQADTIDSERAHYQVSLESATSTCISGRCYLILAKHRSGEQKEELSLNSRGEKLGPW